MAKTTKKKSILDFNRFSESCKCQLECEEDFRENYLDTRAFEIALQRAIEDHGCYELWFKDTIAIGPRDVAVGFRIRRGLNLMTISNFPQTIKAFSSAWKNPKYAESGVPDELKIGKGGYKIHYITMDLIPSASFITELFREGCEATIVDDEGNEKTLLEFMQEEV